MARTATARTDSAPSADSICDDQALIEGALGIEPAWLSDAVGYALMTNSDAGWAYARRQIEKHAGPMLKQAERELRA